jgi:hypothetical protein
MGEEMKRYTVPTATGRSGPLPLAVALQPDKPDREDSTDELRAECVQLREVIGNLAALLVDLRCDAGEVANACGIYGLEEFREPEPERRKVPTLRRKNVFKYDEPKVGDMEKFAGVPMFISAVEKMDSPGMYRITLQSEKP